MNSKASGILNNQWEVQNSGIALLNLSNLFTIAFMAYLLLSTVANNCLIFIATTNGYRSVYSCYIFFGTKRGVFVTAIAKWKLCALPTLAKEIRLSAYDVKLSEFFDFNIHLLLL
jgi:hypothetical protein